MAYHVGKLTEEAKTTLTESMHELLADKARLAKCNPSDLVRDAIYLVFTGATYLDHVANDRRSVMSNQGRGEADNTPTCSSSQCAEPHRPI
jgi:hypothetical protein